MNRPFFLLLLLTTGCGTPSDSVKSSESGESSPAESFTPAEGLWGRGTPTVVRSECGWLLDFEDEEASVVLQLELTDGGFAFSEQDQATVFPCSLSDRSFSCERQAEALSMDDDDDDEENEDAALQLARTLRGSFDSSESGNLETVEVWDCEGADCGMYEDWLELSFPCETETVAAIELGASPGDGEDDEEGDQSALAYAEECAEALGPVPGFDCSEGVVVPITVDGLPVDTDQPGSNCDAPSIVEGDCNAGTRVGRIEGTTSSGTPNDEVVWAYLCRKYDGIVQLIGHNTESGATCFFESNWDVVDRSESLSLEEGLVVGSIPAPSDPEYAAVWKPPAEVAIQACWSCHLADPYVHTPYVDGARLPEDPSQPVIPEVGGIDSSYFLVGDVYEDTEDYLRTLHIDGNGCVSCHRFSDPRSFSFGGGPTYEVNEHMPPSDPGSMAADFQALLDCADAGPEDTPDCEWRQIPGAP